jgi:hypothetical protein
MTMYLYRKARLSVTLAMAIAIFSLALPAQFRAPLPERKTPRAGVSWLLGRVTGYELQAVFETAAR